MHMVAKAPPSASTANAAAPASPAAAAAPGSPTATTGATVNNQPLPNPFAAMFGGMGGVPGMGGMGGMGGVGGMGGLGMDPNMIAQMMNNPLVQQQIQQMLANPQVSSLFYLWLFHLDLTLS